MASRYRPLVEIRLVAADGTALAAEVIAPDAPRRVALIAPALGVRRGFYRPLAEFFAEGGVASLILDYRGVGGSRPASLRGYRATLRDWADQDLTRAVAELGVRWPGVPRVWVGHSIGGQLFGLIRDPPVTRALLIAAQHGHWRNWPGWRRFAMAALWWGAIPAVARAAGRLPLEALRQGEDVPAGVAREWARWGRDREYVVGVARRRGDSGFDRFGGPLRSYALADDTYAPPSTVRPLAEAFRAAQLEYREVSPSEIGATRLGHFGAFRAGARPLWAEWRQWLLAD
jgi:predicted alpha/beta hydrolase